MKFYRSLYIETRTPRSIDRRQDSEKYKHKHKISSNKLFNCLSQTISIGSISEVHTLPSSSTAYYVVGTHFITEIIGNQARNHKNSLSVFSARELVEVVCISNAQRQTCVLEELQR